MAFRMQRAGAVRVLQEKYGMRADHAERAVDIAIEHGLHNTTSFGYNDDGIITITLVSRPTALGRDRGDQDLVTITKFSDDSRKLRAGKVAAPVDTGYSQTRQNHQHQRETRTKHMPPKGKTKPAEPTVEDEADEAEGERNYTIYADKKITDTMSDFADWIVAEVYDGDRAAFDEADPERLVSLAGTLRMEFQRSDLNKTRREERRAARAAQAKTGATETDEDEADEDPAPPAKPARGRPKGTTRGATPPASRPARGARRGKPAATAAAPY